MAKGRGEASVVGIMLIRKRGERLGVVAAASAAEAIKVAIRMFGITDPERQRRLSATRIVES
jgi:hypothetical protein